MLLNEDEYIDLFDHDRVVDLTDDRYATDPGFIARQMKNFILSGSTVEDVAYYSHEELKVALTHFKIPNRSYATTKYKMAQLLVSWFDGAGYDNPIQIMFATLTVQDENSLQDFLRQRGYYD